MDNIQQASAGPPQAYIDPATLAASKRKWSLGEKGAFVMVSILTGFTAPLLYLLSQKIYDYVANKLLLGSRDSSSSGPTPFSVKHDNALNAITLTKEQGKKIRNLARKWQTEISLHVGNQNFNGIKKLLDEFPEVFHDIGNEWIKQAREVIQKKLANAETPEGDKKALVALEEKLKNAQGHDAFELQLCREIFDLTDMGEESDIVGSNLVSSIEAALKRDKIEPEHLAEVSFKTSDKPSVELNGMVIKHPNQAAIPAAQKKWIICFLGQGGHYETQLKDLIKMSKETGANVMAFNYRGVGLSADRPRGPFEAILSEQDLIADGEAALTYLTKKERAEPGNILLYGHSQGGAVATQVAVNHQEPGKAVRLCVDRSYTSYRGVSTELGRIMLGKVGAVLGRFFAFTISRQWRFDSTTAFAKIADQYKFTVSSAQDDVIPGAARLKKVGEHHIELATVDQRPGKDTKWWHRLLSFPLRTAHNVSIFAPSQSIVREGESSPKEQFVAMVRSILGIASQTLPTP